MLPRSPHLPKSLSPIGGPPSSAGKTFSKVQLAAKFTVSSNCRSLIVENFHQRASGSSERCLSMSNERPRLIWRCVCVKSVCVYTNIHIYMHVYIHTYIQTYLQIYKYI